MPKNNKTMILCLVDGIGISSSWRGNSFTQKGNSVFTRLFNEYPSELLKTRLPEMTQIGLAANPQSSYETILSGRIILPFLDQINKTISDKTFSQQPNLHKLFESPQKQFSSLHLLGTLSKDEYYGSKKHLLEILRISRCRKIYNIYIHLFVDNSYMNRTELINDLQEIENYASASNVGKIVSLVGHDYLDVDKAKHQINLIIDCLISGKESQALSFDQIINLYSKNKDLSALSPTVILENDYPAGRINDFDTILFFDHNTSAPNHLLNKLAIPSKFSLQKIPRSTNIFTLTPTLIREYAPPIFDNQTCESFLSILPKDNKQLLVFDERQISYFNCFADLKNKNEIVFSLPDGNINYNLVYEQILNRITQSINMYDIIIISAPNIDRSAKSGNISATLNEINTFNSFLNNLEKIVINNDLILLLTSNFGRAENLNDKRETVVLPSFNPVPFVAISNYKAKLFNSKTKSNDELISNLLTLKHMTIDIAPSILQMLGLPKPASMEGESLF